MRSEYPNKSEIWVGSPFEWIRSLSPRKKGSVAEKFLSFWLKEIGFTVGKTGDSDADLLVNNRRVEIKFSTLWDSGVYKFQQLRDQDYDFILCFGLSPLDAHCWLLPKKEVLYRWNLQDGIVPQHKGATGKDTAWLSVIPDSAPEWMQKFGGQLSASKEVLKSLLV
jgi:hypothetical protein